MSRTPHRHPRGGYTLIELLVVMAIIGILVGITIPAVQKFREIGPRMQAQNDIRQFEQAIESFKSTYTVKYVPSAFIASDNYSAAAVAPITQNMKDDSRRYYKNVWPRGSVTSNGFGYSDQRLDGSQCLAFFLMGPSKQGFYDQPQPFAIPPTAGKLFIDFPQSRMDSTGTRFLDPWGQPYVYFSCKEGNDYNYFGFYYGNGSGGYTPAGTSTFIEPLREPSGKFMNSHSHQIISAGKNGRLSGFGSGGIRLVGQGDYTSTGAGGDDLSNVQGRVLSAQD